MQTQQETDSLLLALAIWYYRAMGVQVDSSCWERKRPGQSCTAGVILRGSFALKGVLLLWFIFLLLEKGSYMNIAPEMLIIHDCLFLGHKYFGFSS